MNKPILYYVYDPMCSWCWGYNPTWHKLQQKLSPLVDIQYLVGGLAPDSDEPMADDMKAFLQHTWRRISAQLGTEFNFDFWRDCQPRRSTYPACRATLIARNHNLEQEMYLAIQQAYYLKAKNPSDLSTLTKIAKGLGLNEADFVKKMASESLNNQLRDEIRLARAMPINGFPSLVLAINGNKYPIVIDYLNWKVSYDDVIKRLPSQ
ncbi:DsbA family protein [Thalassotalea crassostreae]|uniref:DsbA family protein n=1 Tax=Thalassotalea crassostreae TaxID=1763536 RepID=UPI000839665A|nr:DsbA family protein [Thalassotalea crassostreae]